MDISKLKWSQHDVTTKMAGPPGDMQARTRCAYEYLMSSSKSSYRDSVEEHRSVLLRGEEGQRLPHDVLLRRYVERAMWPCILQKKPAIPTGTDDPQENTKV